MVLAGLMLTASFLAADTPPAAPEATEIMRRVAENQERAMADRAAWVFDQDVFVRLQRPGGKLAREETRKYVVAPSATGAHRKIVSVEGKILDGKKEISYNTAGFRTKNTDIDGALTDSFAREVMWHNRLGPMEFWFPLTAELQAKYKFTLEGQEKYQSYDAWRISYRENDGQGDWRGEALIEKNELQPILLTSEWASKVPLAVTMALGISIKQVGAKITYRRLAKDVWFPVTGGGEMKLRVLFFYDRTIAFRSTDSGFRKTDVQSSIEYEPGDSGPR
ncbi:MAG TPA: hypothetical protein VG273_04185 [Bryobacteraceae bacterium]|jgi:hypothetical protein|nr:hypothetical protein [Bryobacteraceae bacterium]